MSSQSPPQSPTSESEFSVNVINQEIEGDLDAMPRMNISSQRFPFCLVWTPIPVITWYVDCEKLSISDFYIL